MSTGERPEAFEWATDDNFASGPAAGQPTKLDPPAWPSNVQGHIPGAGIVAEHENRLMGELGKWSRFLGDIQVRSWQRDVATIAGLDGPAVILWQDQAAGVLGRRWIVAGSDGTTPEVYRAALLDLPIALAVNAGYTNNITWGAIKSGLDAPTTVGLFVVGGDFQAYQIDVWRNNTDTPIILTSGANEAHCAVYEPANERFLVGGVDQVNIPSVWRISTGATPAEVDRITITPAGASTVVRLLARNGTHFVGLGDGTNCDVYVSDDAGATWSAAVTAIDDPVSLVYADELGLFVALTGTACYTSPDGATWTEVATAIHALTREFHRQQLVAAGRMLIAGVLVTSGENDLAYSSDGGATWLLVAVNRGGGASVGTIVGYSRDRGQLAAGNVTTSGTDTVLHESLAAGLGLLRADGTLVEP